MVLDKSQAVWYNRVVPGTLTPADERTGEVDNRKEAANEAMGHLVQASGALSNIDRYDLGVKIDEIIERLQTDYFRKEERPKVDWSVESKASEVLRDLIARPATYQGEAPYILPLGRDEKKIVVTDPKTYPFGGSEWLKDSTAYVLQRRDKERTRPTRIVIGSGVDEKWFIGNTWDCRHDQTNAYLGLYEVVGIVLFGSDGKVKLTCGHLPSTPLAGAVFK